MRFLTFAIALLIAVPTVAVSQSAGLLIGIQEYDNLPDQRRGGRIVGAADELEAAGMEVISLRGATWDEIQDALVQFGQMSAQAETLLVALSGRFVHSPTETFFLASDGEAGPLATLPGNSLPLSTVLAWLSTKPGKAVLVLTASGANTRYGPLLANGIGELDIPQGVTVLRGPPKPATELLARNLAQPGRPFVGAAIQRGMRVEGYAPRTMVFLEGRTAPPRTADDRLADIRDWRAANSANTVDAYRGYLEKHPRGEFARMAENRIDALTDTPEARAERAEQALDLNREARRDIQRKLSLLGFNTRGIDGIFGRGTRAAITEWQRSERFDPTGFVTREQVALLNEQAERRAAELEAEAEERRQQQLADDLSYWDQTGALGDEAGLRAYLNRYPDGEYAELAMERLAVIEDRKRTRAGRQDRQLWDQVTEVDTAEAYRVYLERSPNGTFREEAQARLRELEQETQNAQANARYARAEAAMNLSPRTRQVVESRLKALGLRPGPVDGVFDDDTRRAIRRYQSARNMEETGYLSEAVVVQLMADTVRQIFR